MLIRARPNPRDNNGGHKSVQLVVLHIDEIVDGELPASRKATLLEKHMTGCTSCRDEAEVVHALKRGIARVAEEADAQVLEHLNALARRLCSGEHHDG